jgi:hypothetical protein
MKKLITRIFKRLKLRKMQNEKDVFLTQYSQPHVLRQRMRDQEITHGQTVTADLNPVRLEFTNAGTPVMYFCPLSQLSNIAHVTSGDGGKLPHEATLKGITVPAGIKPGLYDLKNVTLFSNGTLQVIANKDTVFEPYEEPVRPIVDGCGCPDCRAQRNYEYTSRGIARVEPA